MKNFKRILALLLISTTVFGAWYNFIGQLQFDPNLPVNPPLSRGMMFYESDKETVSFYDQANLIQVKSLEGKRSYTYKGEAELAELTDWTATGGTFTKSIVATDLVDGIKSWKWAAPSQGNTLLMNYVPPEGIQNDAQLHAYEFKYNYGGTDDDYELRVNCTSPVSTIIDSASNIQILQREKIARGFYQVPEDCLAVDVGLECTNVSGCDDLVYNKFHVFDYTFPTVKGVESESARFEGLASSMTSALSGVLRFGTLNDSPSNLISYDDSTGFFTSSSDLNIVANISAVSAGTTLLSIELSDGSKVFSKSHTGATEATNVSASFEIKTGQSFKFQSNGTLTAGGSVLMNITATVSSTNVVFERSNSIADWSQYTPITQGIGTPTLDLYWRRDGADLLLRGRYDPLTATAAEVQIGLPSGLAVKADVNIQVAGSYFIGVSTQRHGGAVLITGGDTYLNIGLDQTFGSTSGNALTPSNGNSGSNPEDIRSFTARIPIEGWLASDLIYSVPVTNEVENVYSARIANNGTATIVSQSAPFIESVVRTALGRVTITWKAGFFGSIIPNVEGTTKTINRGFSIVSENSTSVDIVTYITSTVVAEENDFNIIVQRQDSDYKAPRGYFLGTMARTAHVTGGVEYKTADTWNGKTIYARSYEVTSDITSNTTIDTIPLGLNGIDVVNVDGNSMSFISSGDARCHYDTTTGNIRIVANGTQKFFTGSTLTFKYTK